MVKYSKATIDFMDSFFDKDPVDADLETRDQKEIPAYGPDSIKEDIGVLKLKSFLFNKFGPEWLEWLPEVVNKTLFNQDMDNILTDKIQAIRVCYKTDAPWTEWDIFENVGKAFNHQKTHFGFIQPLTLGECVSTSEIMSKLRPKEKFSDEVLSYIGSVAASEDYLYIPENYKAAKGQKYLDKFVHDKDVQSEIKSIWGKIKKKPLLELDYKEDSLLQQQIAQLAILDQYVKENIYA